MALKKTQKSLKNWTADEYTTPSGKKSSKTGEVYLPKKQIKKLKSTPKGKKKLAAATKKKRKATKQGKQYSSHGLLAKGNKKKV
jgi:hypothetical protein